MLSLIIVASLAAADEASCDAPPEPALPLSAYAHTLNEDFIAKVAAGHARAFRPAVPPASFDASGTLHAANFAADKFFTYDTNNGWNNQLLNLLCALDMARLLNRTLTTLSRSRPAGRTNVAPEARFLLEQCPANEVTTAHPDRMVVECRHASPACDASEPALARAVRAVRARAAAFSNATAAQRAWAVAARS